MRHHAEGAIVALVMTMQRGESAAPGGAQILLVEDVLEQREPVTEILRARGYEVTIAVDGGAAVREAGKRGFDVIIMDIALPVMDGIEAIRRIRAAAAAARDGKRPHVIVLSAQVDARTRELAFEAGCDQFMIKPCSLDAIASAVGAYLAKRDGIKTPLTV